MDGRLWFAAMRRSDWAAAWAINDAVLASRDPATRDDPRLPYHLRWVWDGRDWRGRHVLVRCYHGLGDTLQFARYLPALAAGAASLTVEAQPELLPQLAGMADGGRLVAFDPAAPRPPAECDIEIMELFHALRLPPDHVAPERPAPEAEPVGRPPARGGQFGLCWQAGGWDAARSVPEALLAPLLGQGCISLQPRPTGLPVSNPGGCPKAIEATARLIDGLAVVVTVDTMVAHLAGVLNRPVRLMLKHDADWRWGHAERTPWYPSMRLFRQPQPGNWAPVIAAVAADLAQRRGGTATARTTASSS